MKKSIARQLALLFIGLLVAVMTVMLLVNNIYMPRFYEMRLQRTLKRAWQQVDAHISADGTVDEEFFENEYSANEICYKCPQLKDCKQEHNKKCF